MSTPTSTLSSPLSPPSAPSEHEILDGSSLASVIDSNNDRHVFFQEKTGIIRHAWFISSLNSWQTSRSLVVASDARNYTPMSASMLTWNSFNGAGVSHHLEYYDLSRYELMKVKLHLIYINATDYVTGTFFFAGAWDNSNKSLKLNIPLLTAATNSRQLSLIGFSDVAGILNDSYLNARFSLSLNRTGVTNNSMLFFETENGAPAAFLVSIYQDQLSDSGISRLWTQIKLPQLKSSATQYNTIFQPFSGWYATKITDARVAMYMHFDPNDNSWSQLVLDPQNCCDLSMSSITHGFKK